MKAAIQQMFYSPKDVLPLTKETAMDLKQQLEDAVKNNTTIDKLTVDIEEVHDKKAIGKLLEEVNITHLTLENYHPGEQGCASFWSCSPTKKHKEFMDSILKNSHIQQLTLDHSFLNVHVTNGCWAYFGSQFNLGLLVRMAALVTLEVLSEGDWSGKSFKGLQKLLTDNKCQLTKLILTGGETTKHIDKLEKAFKANCSLKEYEGPGHQRLQDVLNERNKTQEETARCLA